MGINWQLSEAVPSTIHAEFDGKPFFPPACRKDRPAVAGNHRVPSLVPGFELAPRCKANGDESFVLQITMGDLQPAR